MTRIDGLLASLTHFLDILTGLGFLMAFWLCLRILRECIALYPSREPTSESRANQGRTNFH